MLPMGITYIVLAYHAKRVWQFYIPYIIVAEKTSPSADPRLLYIIVSCLQVMRQI